MLLSKDMDVAGCGDEHVPERGRIVARHDPVALHSRRERPHRVGLDDNHLGAEPGSTLGDADTAVAVPGDHDGTSGKEDVRRSQYPVERGLTGAVTIVEEMLGVRVVDRHHREPQDAVLLHRPEPDDTCRRLLHPPDQRLLGALVVQDRGHVAPVVEYQIRLGVEHGIDVPVEHL